MTNICRGGVSSLLLSKPATSYSTLKHLDHATCTTWVGSHLGPCACICTDSFRVVATCVIAKKPEAQLLFSACSAVLSVLLAPL